MGGGEYCHRVDSWCVLCHRLSDSVFIIRVNRWCVYCYRLFSIFRMRTLFFCCENNSLSSLNVLYLCKIYSSQQTVPQANLQTTPQTSQQTTLENLLFYYVKFCLKSAASHQERADFFHGMDSEVLEELFKSLLSVRPEETNLHCHCRVMPR